MTAERPVRVVLVEDHALIRTGLRTALESSTDVRVVAEAENGVIGLEEIERHRPDVAVIDIGLPGLDGIELTRRVRTTSPNTRVVILTMHELEEQVFASLAAGADAYCVKSSRTDGVVRAVHVAGEGGAYFDPRIAAIVMRHLAALPRTDAALSPRSSVALPDGTTPSPAASASSPLTPRETEVLRLIASGEGNAEIAAALCIGLGTVKGHVRDILDKLAASDRTHAAVVALRRGLI